MFSILVSSDGLAWETENAMAMDLGRFNEYSGVEADSIAVARPETLTPLESAETLLMYETGAKGPNVDLVRFGTVSNLRAGRKKNGISVQRNRPVRQTNH